MSILHNSRNLFAPILIPLLEWLPNYNLKRDLLSDLSAGVTVFIFLIPQGMAYAILAGLPPVYGLYSSTVPLYIYAFFGTSKQLSIGPMAITSLLLGTGCQSFGYITQSNEYITIALNISMEVGIIMLIMGLLKAGSLSNLISQSVLTPFITASALIISLSQLKYIFGINVPRFSYSHETIFYLISHLNETNPNSFALGMGTWIILYIMRDLKKRNFNTLLSNIIFKRILSVTINISNLLAIIIGAIIAKYIIKSGSYIEIVGTVPSGLLAPSFQFVGWNDIIKIFPTSLAIAFVSFTGNWAIAKKFSIINKYEVNSTQELICYGLCNIIGVLFNSMVVSGGLARTAVNAEIGAKTQLASCITATFIIISLLFFTSFFYYIPMSVLAAIIEVSVIGMIEIKEIMETYKLEKKDFIVMISTFLITFFIGAIEGLFFGILISVFMIIYSIAFPNIAHLGKLCRDGGIYYKDLKRFTNAVQIPGVSIIRMDASLTFVNSSYFQQIVYEAANGFHHSHKDPVKRVIIDTSAWIDIDISGIKLLFELRNELMSREIILTIASAKGILRDKLYKSNYINQSIDCKYWNMSIDEAINSDPILSPQHTVDNYSGLITSPIHISESNVGGYMIADDAELSHTFHLIDNDPQLMIDEKDVVEEDLEEN